MYIKRIETEMGNHIFFNKETFKKYNLFKQKLNLNLGVMKQEVTIDCLDDLAENVIGIPKFFLEQITIPEDIEFDWYIKESNLVIGPFIGIVRYYSMEKIAPRNLNFLLRWLIDYNNIKGLIYVIPLTEIEEGRSTINGFYYDPNKKKNKRWTYGTFPFPSAAFNRPFLRVGKKYQTLVNIIGDTCFNKKEFGKWEFYSWMLQDPLTETLVPYTENLTQFSQVSQMLEKYEVVYLKRRYGGQGKGILQVKKNNSNFEVINISEGKEVFTKEKDMEEYIGNVICKQKYIIQQGVPFKVKDKQIDFRVYLQKDGSKKWKATGIIARVAKSGKIITNIRYTDQILSGKYALMTLYEYDERLTNEIITKIEKACLLAGLSIDKYAGHFGDIALDLVFDGDTKKIYFLEANSGYAHKSLVKINDNSLREEILNRPMAYAKALAGFSLKK